MGWFRKAELPPSTDQTEPQRTEWGFIAALTLAMGVGPLLLHALSALSPLIIAEFSLSRAQFGALSTTAFIGAALSSRIVGGLVDRINERMSMYLLYGGSILALWLAAAAQSYTWMLIAVMLSGIVQALANPLTNRLIAGYVPLRQRGTMTGVKQAGVQLARAFAGLMPVLALAAGWRGAMTMASVLALIGLVLSALHIPGARTAVPRPPQGKIREAQLPTIVWWLAAYAFFSGFGLQATNVYLPLYGYERLGLTSTTAGALTAVIGIVGLVARIVWGRISNRSDAARTILVTLASGAAVGIVLILLAERLHAGLVLAGAVVVGGTGIAANVVLMIIILRVVPHNLVGRATGAQAIGLYLGFAAGPVSFGGLVDATGDYQVGWLTALGSLVVASLLATLRRHWTPPATTTARS